MKKSMFILYLVSAIFYYLLIKEIINTLNVFYEPAFIVLMILYLIFGYALYVDNKKWQFVTYLLGLITLLFYRKSAHGFNFDFYMTEWIKFLFKNKIVTINIIGNILLFIPLGLYLKNIIYGVSVITILELLQVLFKRGLFDIVDIFLNTIGILIGVVIVWMIKIKKTI